MELDTIALIPAARRSRGQTFRIAASDSPASEIRAADFLCDGVDDQADFNEAYSQLPANGGTIAFAAGTYNFSGTALLNANKKVRVEGDGALIVPAPDVTAFMVNNPILGGTAKNACIDGFDIRGATIDGEGETGILVRDCGRNIVRNIRCENLGTGFHLQSFSTGLWAESNHFEALTASQCGTGFFADRQNDYSSFSQTYIADLNLTHCAIAFNLGPTADLFRSRLMCITCWVPDGGIGLLWQGGMQGSIVDFAFERADVVVPVSRRAVVVAATAESLPLNAYLHLNFVGGEPDPWTALIDDPENKMVAYIDRGIFTAKGATSLLNARVQGDTASRFRVDPASSRIVIGDGTGVGAVTLKWASADLLATDDSFSVLGSYLKPPVKTDANRGSAATAGAGAVIYNSTDGKLNVSNGTDWTLPDGTTT